MNFTISYSDLAKLLFAGLMLAFLASGVEAKVFNLDPCTESSCETEKGMAKEATDHFYQSCSVNGTNTTPSSMHCNVKNGGTLSGCEKAADSGDSMWCSCTNAQEKKKTARITVNCPPAKLPAANKD